MKDFWKRNNLQARVLVPSGTFFLVVSNGVFRADTKQFLRSAVSLKVSDHPQTETFSTNAAPGRVTWTEDRSESLGARWRGFPWLARLIESGASSPFFQR